MKVFSSKRIVLKVDELKYRKIYCLQARQCINQPGKFTGWGSEDRVNDPPTYFNANAKDSR